MYFVYFVVQKAWYIEPFTCVRRTSTMAAQRRIDLVLDSVKRLLRIGASANLLNLLQKQHPADLAQIFSELQDKDREAAFSLLAERNGRLAMETISELGPENGAAYGDGVSGFSRTITKPGDGGTG